jgi:hypothetical protein
MLLNNWSYRRETDYLSLGITIGDEHLVPLDRKIFSFFLEGIRPLKSIRKSVKILKSGVSSSEMGLGWSGGVRRGGDRF